MPENSKILIVGDGAIGKTKLIERFKNQDAAWIDGDEYEPTTFNNFTFEWDHVEKGQLSIELWDTAGQEAFEQLRKLSYPGTDIFLIGYSCNSALTLNNVAHKWLPELGDAGNEDPWFILVGTKCDLERNVTEEEVEEAAKSANACTAIATSAKTNIGIDDLIYKVQMLAFYKIAKNPRPNWGEESQWNDKTVGSPVAKPVAVKANAAFDGGADVQATIVAERKKEDKKKKKEMSPEDYALYKKSPEHQAERERRKANMSPEETAAYEAKKANKKNLRESQQAGNGGAAAAGGQPTAGAAAATSGKPGGTSGQTKANNDKDKGGACSCTVS